MGKIAGFFIALGLGLASGVFAQDEKPWVVYEGKEGPGAGKKIVLISGDEEYRSEEALPQLGKILAAHHGFHCTVLFPIDPKDGAINPDHQNNIPGLEAVDSADLVVMLLRFRNLPDEQMKHLVDYIEAGKPILALRTSTHAFQIPEDRAYHKYDWRYKGEDYTQGFGRQVLGETWISHHGKHKHQSARGILVGEQKEHPILRGLKDGDIWGSTDVYGVRLPLPGDSLPLVLGQVCDRKGEHDPKDIHFGMRPDDPAAPGKQNDPMMPMAWTKSYKGGRIFTTTMGASADLLNEGVRRMTVNAAYWCLGLEEKIPASGAKVDLVGDYKPTAYGFGAYTKGVKPSAHRWP